MIERSLLTMKFPQLRMESVMGRIRLEQTPSFLEIRQPKATQSIEQPKAELSIRTTKGKMQIDQSQAWEERNLMSTIRLNEIYAQEGLKAVQEGVARRAEQGSQLLKIEQGGNVIAEQAIENGHPRMKTLSIKYVPSPLSVKMNYEPGELHIDVQTSQPTIDVKINKPEINFLRGGVHIEMDQYPELDIYVVDLYV